MRRGSDVVARLSEVLSNLQDLRRAGVDAALVARLDVLLRVQVALGERLDAQARQIEDLQRAIAVLRSVGRD